jgi:hypothetical protein
MKQPIWDNATSTTSRSNYDDWPLSVVLFRYAWPFWLFQDVSHGDLLKRAAAYSHNRDMRVYLPGYMLKWLISTAMTLEIANGLNALSSPAKDAPDAYLLVATFVAMLAAIEICLLLVTTAIYLYLSKHKSLH